MYQLFRSILFRFDAEKVHYFVVGLLKLMVKFPPSRWIFRSIYHLEDPALEREFIGLKFPNPVGLAAGFDKNAKFFDEMESCGFGFIEIGTLTPKPQDGNPKKRLFRLKKNNAIINRMGFNNGGVHAAVFRLKKPVLSTHYVLSQKMSSPSCNDKVPPLIGSTDICQFH